MTYELSHLDALEKAFRPGRFPFPLVHREIT